jgi:hypothetical protein
MNTNQRTYDLLAEMDGRARFEKAKEIVRTLGIKKIPRITKWQLWKIQSQSKPTKFYSVVQKDTNEYECDCPDFEARGVICKHIMAILIYEITR